MMKERLDGMNAFFAGRISDCRRRESVLMSDDRQDEAVFEKIRANVYDIFRTVLSAAGKKFAAEPEKAAEFFLMKLEQIPSGWAEALKLAQQHEDAAGAETERIKLSTAEDIRQSFQVIWGQRR